MLLNNEQQREILTALIKNTKIGGNMDEAAQTITVLQKLLSEIQNAEIKDKEKQNE